MKTPVKIKEQNKWAIHDFCIGQTQRITGNKLKALYYLIQSKGEPMETKDKELNGVKVLEYTEGQYIGLIHTPIKKGIFFPCKLKTIQLTTL